MQAENSIVFVMDDHAMGGLSPDTDLSDRRDSSTSSSTTATPPPTRRCKLRASCDACGKAKTKCDRTQPSCSRCLSSGLACVYGISRKAGKPPRKQPAGASIPAFMPLPTSQKMPTLLGMRGWTEPVLLDSGVMGGATVDYTFDDVLRDYPSLEDLSSGLGMPTPIYSDLEVDDAAWNGLGPVWPTADGLPPTPPDAMLSLSAGKTSSREDMEGPAPMLCCTSRTKEIMRRLYCADPFSPQRDSPPARILDLGTVLTRNRDVVARLKDLLACPCARSPHSAMLYGSIISRVLLWYNSHAAANATAMGHAMSSAPPALSSHVPAAMSHTQTHRFSQPSSESSFDTRDSTESAALPTPVTVGSFQTENRGLQTALTACLLVSELGPVAELIDEFAMVGRGKVTGSRSGPFCATACDHSSLVVDSDLFESLGTWLRTEHNRIVRKAKMAMSMLDRTLGL